MSSLTLSPPTPQEQLQSRLADPRTVDALNRLLDRLDVVAASVEMVDGFLRRSSEIADNVSESVATLRESTGGAGVTGLLSRLPALARAGAKVADAADSPAFARLAESGVLEKLAAPGTLEAVTALLDRLPLLAFTVQAIEEFFKRGDEVANSIAESVADLRKMTSPELSGAVGHLPQMAAAAVQLSEAVQTAEFANLLDLSRELGKPDVIAKVRFLLDKLDLAVFAVNAVDGFLRRGNEVADSMAEGIEDLRKAAASINTEELARLLADLPKLTEAGHQLLSSGLLEKIRELADAGMVLSNAGIFEPRTVQPLAEVGQLATQAYTAAKAAPQRQYSLFALLRLLKDPETSRTIHLLIEMARQFGRRAA